MGKRFGTCSPLPKIRFGPLATMHCQFRALPKLIKTVSWHNGKASQKHSRCYGHSKFEPTSCWEDYQRMSLPAAGEARKDCQKHNPHQENGSRQVHTDPVPAGRRCRGKCPWQGVAGFARRACPLPRTGGFAFRSVTFLSS